MTRKTTSCLCALSLLFGLALAETGLTEEQSLPFSMPIPEGWRTETIPFPLEFAPDLPYSGLEELRFAPGMFEPDSEELWSYAFVWWVGSDDPHDVVSLSTHLEAYFRGLAKAVAASNEIEVGDATFSASLTGDVESSFGGVAETFDAFVTDGQLRLNVRGKVLPCVSQDHKAIFFALSPQQIDHSVWTQLDAIRDGFSCRASDDDS